MDTEISKLDPGMIRRMAYSKELYLLAQNLLTTGNDIANAEAIVITDAAIDSLLRTIIQHFELKNQIEPKNKLRPDEKFPTVISKLRIHIKDNSIDYNPIEYLHNIRNQIQHNNFLLADTQVHKSLTDAIMGSIAITKSLLGISWMDVSLAYLFEDSLSQELYNRAEKSYSKGNIDDTIIYLIATFEYARIMEQCNIYGSFISLQKFVTEQKLKKIDNDNIDSILEYIKILHNEVEIVKLRLDYKEYRFYSDIALDLLTPSFEDPKGPNNYNPENPTQQNADLYYDYWKETLSEHLQSWKSLNAENRAMKDIRSEWIPFAFRFIEKSILTWQRIHRRGLMEFIGDIIEDFKYTTKKIQDENIIKKK